MNKLELAKGGITFIGAYLMLLFGDFNTVFKVLLVLMILDYATGLLKAIHNKKVDSRIGLKGITKKIMIICVIALANMIDIIIKANGMTIDYIRDLTIMFYSVNETISILENVGEFIEIPDYIRKVLAQLNGKGGKDNE